MFRTQWVLGESGNWYSYTIPSSFQTELIIISILSSSKDLGEVTTQIVSEILHLPPQIIDDDLYSDQVWGIFQSVFPNLDKEEVAQKAKTVQSDIESKSGDGQDAIAKMLAFLSRHGNLQPSEILRLPRATVDSILRELVELLEVDKKFELELSVVSALSKLFGGDTTESTSSGSSTIRGKDAIDLANLDPSDLSQFASFEGVEVR